MVHVQACRQNTQRRKTTSNNLSIRLATGNMQHFIYKKKKTVLADSLDLPQRLNEILIARSNIPAVTTYTLILFLIILLVKIDQLTLTFCLFGYLLVKNKYCPSG